MSTTFSLRQPDSEVGDEPATPQHRRRLRLVIIAGVVVVLAAVLTWVVAFSSLFGVRSVQVRGAHTLTNAQVEAAAHVRHGTALIRLDTAAVTRRVEALAGVATAQVSTSFPSTVVVTITERMPVGYLRSDGRVLLVDRSGDAYRSVSTAPSTLPKLVVPTGAAARSARAAVAQVGAALPVSLRPDVQSIDALDPSAITLVLTKGRIVQWGSASGNAAKGRILPVLLAHAKDDTQFDVVDPQRPFSH